MSTFLLSVLFQVLTCCVHASQYYRTYQSLNDLSQETIPIGTTTANYYSNNIVSVPRGIFQNLPSLEYIYLYNNKISEIAGFAFSTPALKRLDLYNNDLEVIKAENFRGLFLLGELYLYNNKIRIIEDTSFQVWLTLWLYYWFPSLAQP